MSAHLLLATVLALVAIAILVELFSGFLRLPSLAHAPATRLIGRRVSVIIAARDEERSIAAAIESLLAQTYRDLEILVVNDRSQDATGDVLNELSMRHPRLQVVHVRELPAGWL